MRPYFIVNPIADGGKVNDKFSELRRYLDAHGADYGFKLTEKPGQSTELAEQAYSEGERFIVSVGGDGTVNEIGAALYTKKDAVMGICPFGTGNDFARALKLPSEPEEIGRILIGGAPRRVDIGMADGKPFTNVAGFGFDVYVVINTERYKNRFHGMLPYLLGIVRTMLHIKRIPVKVIADGQEIEDTILLISVGNGSHFGGGMAALPNADPSDGLFDVCIVKSVSFFRFLSLLPLFIKGRHLGKKPVRYFRAKEVRLECERGPLQLDGELGEYAPVTFSIIPGALNVMLPNEAPSK